MSEHKHATVGEVLTCHDTVTRPHPECVEAYHGELIRTGRTIMSVARVQADVAAAEAATTEPRPDQSIEEIAAAQGIGPIENADDLRMPNITDEEADAFLAAMEAATPPVAPPALDVDALAQEIGRHQLEYRPDGSPTCTCNGPWDDDHWFEEHVAACIRARLTAGEPER